MLGRVCGWRVLCCVHVRRVPDTDTWGLCIGIFILVNNDGKQWICHNPLNDLTTKLGCSLWMIYFNYRVRVANELGAGNAEGAKFASIVCVFTSLLVGILFWVLILAIPDKLAMIFTSTTSVITMVEQLSVLLSFTVLLNCIQPVLSGVWIIKHFKFWVLQSNKITKIWQCSFSLSLSPGVAVGSGWQALVAFVNIGSYYIVGVPLGLVMGWFLDFGIEVCLSLLQALRL